MPRPQLIGVIDGSIEDDSVEFTYVEDNKPPLVLPDDFMEHKADQFVASIEDRDQRIQFHEMLAEYGSEIAMIIVTNNIDIHLLINSSGGDMDSWLKYALAIDQLKTEGSEVTAHALQRAHGLAADIFIQTNHQTALMDTAFTFDAGDASPDELTSIFLESATADNIVLTPSLIEEKLRQHSKQANKDWTYIKNFLLSNPGSPTRQQLKELFQKIEEEGPRAFPFSGHNLQEAGCFVTLYQSVREMFHAFCQKTGLDLTVLPPSKISQIFSLAAAEEETNLRWAL